jgi:uncharacterized membrane protein YhhN
LTALLTALAVGTALLHIRAEYRGPRWQVYLCKPATTLSILALALWATPQDAGYRGLVVAGLACSLAGDVFLMLPSDRFREGLASFLAAHLFYVAAFSRADAGLAPLALLASAIYGCAVLAWLSPNLGRMKLPAATYMLAIAAMAWRAAAPWSALRSDWALLALLGAVLFVASDSLLAVDRFRGRFAGAQALILGTYYPAQWLIARSVAS